MICCKNIVDVTLFFFNSSIDFDNYNFFFLPFLATWLPQFIFYLFSIPYNFGNLVATIAKSHSGTPTRALHRRCLCSGMNVGNTITEIHFFSFPITSLNFLFSHTFSYNFCNDIAEIQYLSSFCQITLNSAYNNNKLRFLQYLAKRLCSLTL